MAGLPAHSRCREKAQQQSQTTTRTLGFKEKSRTRPNQAAPYPTRAVAAISIQLNERGTDLEGATTMPQKRPRTKASKKRLARIKDERRKKKTQSRVMPNR
jgi:hypothetical protein